MNDAILPALRGWLATAPALDGAPPLFVDDTETAVPRTGLFPQGVAVRGRRANVLGEVTVRYRASFVLRLALPYLHGDDALNTQNAQRLLDLQRWVAQQSAARTAPVFGDDPLTETLTATAGRLENRPQLGSEGLALYTVTLTADYDGRWPA